MIMSNHSGSLSKLDPTPATVADRQGIFFFFFENPHGLSLDILSSKEYKKFQNPLT
jgi:hypothetical protein